jgi:Flp pilus assembly protein TadG
MGKIARILATRYQTRQRALTLRAEPHAREAGQALVELALVLPIFMLILVGAAECARLAYAWIEVANAARAGVQYGAQNHITAVDFAGMAQAAIEDSANLTTLTATATSFCRCSDGTVISCARGSGSCSGHVLNYVQVNTSAPIDPLVYLPGLPKTYTLQGQAIMRVEQ